MKHLLLSVAITASTLAQNPPASPPRQARAAEQRPALPAKIPEGVEVKRDVVYVPEGGPRRMLDVYFRPKADKPQPLVVWIHGGAWQAGSKDRTPALPLLEQGFAVASVTYRFSKDAVFPAQIEDCKAAIRWLRAHARELNIDPARVGAWGSSAGGHLVALLGTAGDQNQWDVGENRDQTSRVQAVCDFFGPAELATMGAQSKGQGPIKHDAPDSPESRLIGGAVQDNREKAKAASPITYASQDDPPFLIMHGMEDPLVPHQQSVDLEAALKKAGGTAELVSLPKTGHGGGQFNTPETREKVVAFFKRVLRVE